jgi:phosphoribosylformylglycinamidine synthase subunit PurQ / glutaminase
MSMPLSCRAASPTATVVQAVKRYASDGGLVMGFCNGFQILTESGILPGALLRNQGMKFICKPVDLIVGTSDSPFTHLARKGQRLRIPVAHGEGNYFADDRTLDELVAEDRIAFRYATACNGSQRDIAGILSRERNVLGMMPHPERAADPLMGSTDGLVILQSVASAVAAPVAK